MMMSKSVVVAGIFGFLGPPPIALVWAETNTLEAALRPINEERVFEIIINY
jgi:hypothetical protein